MIEHAASK